MVASPSPVGPGVDGPVAAGAQAVYDAIASAYDRELRDELDRKPVDRALLTAFVELAGPGPIADVGCGPGHVTRFLAQRHPDVLGLDHSPGMIAVARQRSPELAFAVGSMLRLPVTDGTWAGVVALYSIIHLPADERLAAFAEFARVIRPGGWLLVAFHVDSTEFAAGTTNHLTTWFGERVELGGYFLAPMDVKGPIQAAGFTVVAELERQPTAESLGVV